MLPAFCSVECEISGLNPNRFSSRSGSSGLGRVGGGNGCRLVGPVKEETDEEESDIDEESDTDEAIPLLKSWRS